MFPRFAPDGYSPIGTEGWLKMDRQEGVHHVSGSYTRVMGGHNLKLGSESRFNFLDYAQPGYPSGQFTFGRGITCRDRFSCGGNEGNGVATMLLGWPTGGDFHIDPKVFTRSAYWGFYAHDDWKVALEADVEPRPALRLRRAALGAAGSPELLGPRGAVADPGSRLRHARRDQVRRRRQPVAVRRRHEQLCSRGSASPMPPTTRRPSAAATGCSTRSAAPPCSATPAARSTSTRRRRSRSTPTRRATRR